MRICISMDNILRFTNTVSSSSSSSWSVGAMWIPLLLLYFVLSLMLLQTETKLQTFGVRETVKLGPHFLDGRFQWQQVLRLLHHNRLQGTAIVWSGLRQRWPCWWLHEEHKAWHWRVSYLLFNTYSTFALIASATMLWGCLTLILIDSFLNKAHFLVLIAITTMLT